MIIMNALDNDNGRPLSEIMTPEPNEDQKEIYIRANREGSKPHTIAKDGAAILAKGGYKNPTAWGGGAGGEQWKSTGWKEGKGPWQPKTGGDWEDQERGWVEYNKDTATGKDLWKDYNAGVSKGQ